MHHLFTTLKSIIMNKKYLLAISIIIVAVSAQGQIAKGTFVLGGNFGISDHHSSFGNNKNTNHGFFISPVIGLTTKENKVSGIYLNYGQDKSNSTGDASSKQSTYGGGVFIRKYKPLGKAFYLFGESDLGVNYQKTESENGTTREVMKWKAVSISLNPGVSYAFSKSMQLEVSMPNILAISYSENESEYIFPTSSTGSTSHGVDLYANLNPARNFAVGFRFFFGK
jgi:hypothetical protein